MVRDPVTFQTALLHRTIWQKQRDIANAAATKRSTAVKGCHASGKTFLTAGAVLHHLAIHPQGKVITIAPTLRQVKLIWEEIEVARKQSSIAFPVCSQTGLRISPERYGIGFSSSHGVNAQGFHGQDVLLITDESPGISGDVWDAIEGIRAGGRVRLLKLGNPTVPSGPFFDDFGRGRATTECITISAFDTPNLQHPTEGRAFTIEEILRMPEADLEASPVPYLVTRQWVKEKYLRWGPNNPRYLSRVLGEFPSQSEWSVFDLAWIERARREPTEREIERSAGAFIQVGLDVAAGGDDETAACARVNGIILRRGSWADADPRGKIAAWLHRLRVDFPQYPLGSVVVDTVGVGHGIGLFLADQWPVCGFKAGLRAMDAEQYANSKAEAYFRLRDMYKANYISHLPEALDEETEAQLSAVQYLELPRGQIQIEPKEDARERGVQSPDRAEAEIMAFCQVVPRQDTRVQPIVQISPV